MLSEDLRLKVATFIYSWEKKLDINYSGHMVLQYAEWSGKAESALGCWLTHTHTPPQQSLAAWKSHTTVSINISISSHLKHSTHTRWSHSPSVSPLLSSGFVPGLFSWSTVCELDEEHPMFENFRGGGWMKKGITITRANTLCYRTTETMLDRRTLFRS